MPTLNVLLKYFSVFQCQRPQLSFLVDLFTLSNTNFSMYFYNTMDHHNDASVVFALTVGDI